MKKVLGGDILEKIRINKFIASAGFSSRRSAEEYIKEGRVKVNGKIITELGTMVNPDDEIMIDDKKINLQKQKTYIMLNKPKGYITTSKEQFNRPSILDIVKVDKRVFPVGRLDKDSEGLLLLTNDGEFTNSIIHPTKHIAKTYDVILKNKISDSEILKLKQGVDIGGYKTSACEVNKISDCRIKITIYEGKNRQIRRMIETVDNKVVSLKRVSIGKLNLNGLNPGEYSFLKKEDIQKIFT